MSSIPNDDDDDCGCGEGVVATMISGKPSAIARSLDPRKAIAKSSFFDIHGNLIDSMNDILLSSSSLSKTSLVVFLRSFG